MSTEQIKVSDLSGHHIENLDEQLVHVVITEHPSLEADQRAELDAMPDELKDLSRFSIAAVGLEVTFPGDKEPRRHIMTKNNFDKLFGNGRQADEIVVAAAAVVEVVKQRAAARPSHNRTANGEPLVNYGNAEYAGLPHYGRIGKKEQAYVQANLDSVNERRTAAGHPAIDPANPADAERYGLIVPEPVAAATEQP
jgi:hypothetical protein